MVDLKEGYRDQVKKHPKSLKFSAEYFNLLKKEFEEAYENMNNENIDIKPIIEKYELILGNFKIKASFRGIHLDGSDRLRIESLDKDGKFDFSNISKRMLKKMGRLFIKASEMEF